MKAHKCSVCGTTTEANQDSLIKVGAKIKLRCGCCRKNTTHAVVEVAEVAEVAKPSVDDLTARLLQVAAGKKKPGWIR